MSHVHVWNCGGLGDMGQRMPVHPASGLVRVLSLGCVVAHEPARCMRDSQPKILPSLLNRSRAWGHWIETSSTDTKTSQLWPAGRLETPELSVSKTYGEESEERFLVGSESVKPILSAMTDSIRSMCG